MLKEILGRILYFPIAFFVLLAEGLNRKSRDLMNKRRFKMAQIGSSCCFTADVTIGEKSNILSNSVVNHSHIGSYTYISRSALIQNTIIGNYCSISHDVISGLGAHPIDLFSTSPVFYRERNPLNITVVTESIDFAEYKQIKIGNDVWIGARVIIMDGITIGNGAIVAAGAVVTKDVMPYSIVGGVPAKHIKYRASDVNIANYIKSAWWDLEPHEAYLKMKK